MQSLHAALEKGDYHHTIHQLRLLGHPILQAWQTTSAVINHHAEKIKFTTNADFKKYLIEQANRKLTIDSRKADHITQLKIQLCRLQILLMAWECRDNLIKETATKQDVRLRQLAKFKANLDKNDRYAIHVALLALFAKILLLMQKSGASAEDIELFQQCKTKTDLINLVSQQITRLNSNNPELALTINLDKNTEIDNAVNAILAFTASTRMKKFLKILGILLAGIIALTCGISTGIAIYAAIPPLPIAILMGIVIFMVGMIANFNLFSQIIPDFLLNLVKKGSITEFIDKQGKRQQFSFNKKYILLPLAVLASAAVGSTNAALTFVSIVTLLQLSAPLLMVIVGILASTIFIGISIAMLTAIINMLKKPLMTRQEFINKIKKLTFKKSLSYFIMALLIPLGLFGLVYFRIITAYDLIALLKTFGTQLANALSITISVIAFVAQLAFTSLAIDNLYHAIANFFTKKSVVNPDDAIAEQTTKTLGDNIKAFFTGIYLPISLVSNALGNGILACGTTFSTFDILGGIACGFNSLAGNVQGYDPNNLYKEKIKCCIKTRLDEFAKTAEPNPEKNNQKPIKSEENIIDMICSGRTWKSSSLRSYHCFFASNHSRVATEKQVSNVDQQLTRHI